MSQINRRKFLIKSAPIMDSRLLLFILPICLILFALVVNTAAQNKPFIWVNVSEEGQYPGYKRVVAGWHQDGVTLYVCKHEVNGFLIPGKLHNDQCQIPFYGKEVLYTNRTYQVLVTNAQYHWKQMHDISRAQIDSDAVLVGNEGKSNLYLCRRKMQDGLHPGKYHAPNATCYISWGGKELSFTDGFEVMFP